MLAPPHMLICVQKFMSKPLRVPVETGSQFGGISAAEDPGLWDQEYDKFQVIPSSTRPLPSKALLLFEHCLPLSESADVLDAGCGTGRNAVYLARRGCRVTALDFS